MNCADRNHENQKIAKDLSVEKLKFSQKSRESKNGKGNISNKTHFLIENQENKNGKEFIGSKSRDLIKII